MSSESGSALKLFADAMSAGDIETVDLTHALDADFPVIRPAAGYSTSMSYGAWRGLLRSR